MADTDSDLRDLAWVRALCATGANAGIRLGANLTLREVGAAVSVSPTTVQRWEDGTAKPTGTRAIAYARVLRQLAPTSRRARAGGDDVA
jgi:DNA-binding XRE family transcriptional regulator